MLGPAAETLKKLSSEAPFDFVFLDADKAGYPTYFQEAKRLTRKGSIIVRRCLILALSYEYSC